MSTAIAACVALPAPTDRRLSALRPGYSTRSRVRNAANWHQLAMIGADDGHIHRHRINHRGGMHLCHFVPTAFHPVARFPVIDGFDGFDPYRHLMTSDYLFMAALLSPCAGYFRESGGGRAAQP